MKKTLISLFTAHALLAAPAIAREAAPTARLAVTIGGIEEGKRIPDRFSYCVPDGAGVTKNGGNINPAINWSGAPEGTKSYAVLVVDPDVPASFELANQSGKIIPADFPRRHFYHWVLVNIPITLSGISEGQNSSGIAKNGKPTGKTEYGVNGRNDYPGGGYDGPCPPWNDERLHHYRFIVYALDVPILNLQGIFDGRQAEAAMEGHILAQGEIVGTFSNNQKMLGN